MRKRFQARNGRYKNRNLPYRTKGCFNGKINLQLTLTDLLDDQDRMREKETF